MRTPRHDLQPGPSGGHISDTDAFLLLDGEVPPDLAERLEQHLRSCELCQSTIAGARALVSAIRRTSRLGSTQRARTTSGTCLADMLLASYLEARLSPAERADVETHLSSCPSCLALLARHARQAPLGEEIRLAPGMDGRVARGLRAAVRRTRGETLLAKLNAVIDEGPTELRRYLEDAGKSLALVFGQTFTYPTPTFPPAAPSSDPVVLSPFGKVRHPIVFSWERYQSADSYELCLTGADWSTRTTRSRAVLEQGDWQWKAGQGYTWTLGFKRASSTMAEVRGSFTVVPEDEAGQLARIEGELCRVAPEEDRLTLTGAILERELLHMEAIRDYQRSHMIKPSPGLTYRVACCFDQLGLAHLRDRWSARTVECDG